MSRRMGRPHKFTRETVDRLMRGIRMGLTYKLACKYARIDFATFNNWRGGKFPRQLTDEQKEMKAEFLELLAGAEGDAAARHMSTIMQAAAQGEWKAAAWALERRFPEDFGKQVVELTGKDGGPIELSSKSLRLVEEFAIEEGISGNEEEIAEAVRAYLAQQEGEA